MKPYVRDLLVTMKKYLRGSITIEEYEKEIAAIAVKHGRVVKEDVA